MLYLQSMCSDSDLKDLGLPMGPRKKLQGILKEESNKKVKLACWIELVFSVKLFNCMFKLVLFYFEQR